jgi:shikimate kinase/3-dehydroquinate synthase
MGVGKSSVARALGRKLGARVVDLDAEVESRVGASIASIFAERGEAAFRQIERETVRELGESWGGAEQPTVVALGGGTVTDRATRRMLLEQGVLVTLSAPADELAARVGEGRGRPLLAGSQESPSNVLSRIVAERADAYAECHRWIDTSHRTVDEVADEVREVAAEQPVVVPLGTRSYRVEVGAGIRDRVGVRACEAASGAQALVVRDEHVARPWGQQIGEALEAVGHAVDSVTLPPGEEHKNLSSVEAVWDRALELGMGRDGLVVAVGGGVVGDVAGFAASTLLRGVALAQVPTTLLAMVDSSVGGKTGFNRDQGKNLIGTFHQPRFVLCDVETLETLPQPERTAALAEVVKSAWLQGPEAVAMLERDAPALVQGDPEATIRAIRMAVRLKARVVTADERESGTRMLLNLGHTVGHALEAARGYRGLRHGDAVALGMVAAFRVSRELGIAGPAEQDRVERLLGALGLPTDLDDSLDVRATPYLYADKKRRGGQLHFVVPAGPGSTRIEPVQAEWLQRVLTA